MELSRFRIRRSQPRSWIWNLAAVWFALFTAMAGMSLTIPFLPLYLTELGVPADKLRLWAGWVGGVNFLFAALMAPLWGNLADRIGRKPMALRALIGLAISVVLMGYARNATDLLLLRILQGSLGGFVAEAIALVSVSVPRERLGACLGLVQASAVSGGFIGPLIGGELATRFGYRDTFLYTGGALALALLLVAVFVQERPRAENGGPKPTLAQGLRQLYDLPQMRWMMGAVLCSHAGQMLLNPQISLFVRDLTGPAAEVNRIAGFVTAAPAFSSMAMAALWGRIGDRKGHVVTLAVALAAAALVTPWGALATAWTHLFLVRLAMGAFTSALNPSAHSAVAHRVPEERLAGAFSLLSSSHLIGACAGPLLSGYLATYAGVRPLFLVTAGLLGLGAACAVALHRIQPAAASPPANSG